MNRVLAEVNVPPLYGQIVVQDPGTAELPEWDTGELAGGLYDNLIRQRLGLG